LGCLVGRAGGRRSPYLLTSEGAGAGSAQAIVREGGRESYFISGD
jgi:hypothetical protein